MTLVQLLLDAASVTAILILLAIGLWITFGLMGVINLAHGDLFMCGMYVVVALRSTVGFWLSLPVAMVVGSLIGLLLHESIIRWLWERPLETLLATWGAGMVIRETIKLGFGSGFRQVPGPISGQLNMGPISYSYYRLVLVGACLVVLAAAYIALHRTNAGLYVRAMLDDRETAATMGVRSRLVNATTFAIGAGLAGLAGALTAPLVTVSPEVGFSYLSQAFFVVIVGGAARLSGLGAGGFVIGAGVVLASSYINPSAAQVVVLLVAVAIMRFRPTGLVTA
jgi:urea ABC transporter permease protein UrtB